MIAVARERGEGGQAVQRHVHAEGAGAVLPVPDAREEVRGQRVGRDQPRIEQLWIDVGRDIFRADGRAVVQHYADRAVALDDDLAHTRIRVDRDAAALRGARHRLRDRAHAADGVAPDALLAVHLAEGVVQHHIGRARRVRTGIIADDGIEAEQRLDQIVLEALVQHLAGRAGEEIEQAAALLQRQPTQDVGALERVHRFADRVRAKTVEQVRRRTQHELPQHVGDVFQLAREPVERACVVRAQPRDGLLRPPLAGEQIAAVGRGQKILGAPLDDPQALFSASPKSRITCGLSRLTV